MIQRIQTVFLFLVAVNMAFVLFFPIWQQENPNQSQQLELTAWQMTTTTISDGEVVMTEGKIFLAILAIVAMILAIYSLLQYKKRPKQMLINMINSLVMVTIVGLIIWITHSANEAFNPGVNGIFKVGFWSIFVAMVCNILANRFIRKDEMLVRSVDRIR